VEHPAGGKRPRPRVVAAITHRDIAPDVVYLSECRANGSDGIAEGLRRAGYEHQRVGPDPMGGHAGLFRAARIKTEAIGHPDFASSPDSHRLMHDRVLGWDLVSAYIPGRHSQNTRKHDYWTYLIETLCPELLGGRAVILGDLNTGLHYRDEPGATLYCADLMLRLYNARRSGCDPAQNPAGSTEANCAHSAPG